MKYIRPAVKSGTGRAHERSNKGHKVKTYIGIDLQAKKPTRMKVSECQQCKWWDHQ
jgi:hypothetical protein